MNLQNKIELLNASSERLNAITEYATFPPQPPRHFKMVEKGCSHITWVWDPPVSTGLRIEVHIFYCLCNMYMSNVLMSHKRTGGLPVLDYELSYVVKFIDKESYTSKKPGALPQISFIFGMYFTS
jgi:hypothetical protein